MRAVVSAGTARVGSARGNRQKGAGESASGTRIKRGDRNSICLYGEELETDDVLEMDVEEEGYGVSDTRQEVSGCDDTQALKT